MCKLCSDFMESPDLIWSFHTARTFNFKSVLNCKIENIIYKIDCLPCRKSSVGSTSWSMTSRWPNHKSHIRCKKGTCEIACHFSSSHGIDLKSPLDIFDAQLKKILRVTIIDHVDMTGATSKTQRTKRLKNQEDYWQHQLRTLVEFGGLNKRRAKKETSAKSFTSWYVHHLLPWCFIGVSSSLWLFWFLAGPFFCLSITFFADTWPLCVNCGPPWF